MSEPIAAPKNAPLELKLKIMLRNWSYPEFREVLYKEAKEGEDHIITNAYKRIYMYLRMSELHGAGLGYSKIEETIRSEIGCTPSKHTLRRWLKNSSSPLTKIAVFDVRQPEVGLIMGLILSDGHTRIRYRNGCLTDRHVMFFNTDEGLVEMFKETCRRLGLPVCLQADQSEFGSKGWKLEANSTLLYLLLKRYDEFIVKAPASVQWAFIKGLMLGDGCIGCATFYNTDLKIIRTVSTILRMYGIAHSICGPYPPHGVGKKPIYEIYIKARARERFLKLTGLADSPPRSHMSIIKKWDMETFQR